jgi:hypothetical protein
VGKGILNRGTQVHKSKVKYNRNQKITLDPLDYDDMLSQKQKAQWRSYVSSKLEVEEEAEVDDQENIRRLRETQVPKKLQNKLKRQASEKGLEGNQVEKYIQKVERRMNNRRKSD